MFLKKLLDIYPIYTNIIKYLSDTDIDILCNTLPQLKYIFDSNGYKRKVNIYNDDIDTYIKCLEEYEKHKVFVKEICCYDMINPFLFAPKSKNKIYTLYNCINIKNIPEFVKVIYIITDKCVDLEILSKECKNIEYLFVDARRIIGDDKAIFNKSQTILYGW